MGWELRDEERGSVAHGIATVRSGRGDGAPAVAGTGHDAIQRATRNSSLLILHSSFSTLPPYSVRRRGRRRHTGSAHNRIPNSQPTTRNPHNRKSQIDQSRIQAKPLRTLRNLCVKLQKKRFPSPSAPFVYSVVESLPYRSGKDSASPLPRFSALIYHLLTLLSSTHYHLPTINLNTQPTTIAKSKIKPSVNSVVSVVLIQSPNRKCNLNPLQRCKTCSLHDV